MKKKLCDLAVRAGDLAAMVWVVVTYGPRITIAVSTGIAKAAGELIYDTISDWAWEKDKKMTPKQRARDWATAFVDGDKDWEIEKSLWTTEWPWRQGELCSQFPQKTVDIINHEIVNDK